MTNSSKYDNNLFERYRKINLRSLHIAKLLCSILNLEEHAEHLRV